MAKNKLLIGYDWDRLLGWDVNKEFDFSYDRSFDVAVDSEQTAVFKQDLAARIGDSSQVLCIVGKETYRQRLAGEIRTASS